MDKIWLTKYPKEVAEFINPDIYNSICDIFLENCTNYAEQDAFYNMGQAITYKQLEQQSKIIASYLQNNLKLTPGDRVAIMLPNIIQYPLIMFAILRAGLIVVNVNPLYTPKELTHQLQDSGAKAIFVLENFAHVVQKTIGTTKVEHYIITKLADVFKYPKAILVNFIVKYIKKMVPAYSIPNAIDYKTAINLGDANKYTQPEIKNTDLAFLQYTGGTTGVSKGAMLTHRNIIANILQTKMWISPIAKTGKEIIITALPLYHIFSLMANCFTFMQYGALNVLITNPRDINNFITELKKFKFTAFTAVNTLFNALLNNKRFAEVDFSHLHLTLGGGMAVQQSVAARWQAVTNTPLLEGYGLSETSPAVCINSATAKQFTGYIGLPISSTEVKICDDAGNELDFDTPGELCVKGPQVMQGYWQRQEDTAAVLDASGWLRTGDIATINQQGYVKIVDRKKDMILISGFNVYPNEVEEVIAMLPEVKEVAVIGIAENGNEVIKACIVPNSNTLTKEAIIEHCKDKLTNYKIPKIFQFYQDLPKTNVGKILRRALKD